LEAITEDIVTELDSKLRDAGYSSQAHGRAEQAVAELLGQLKVVASGRKNIFSDFASVVSPSEDETRRFADNAVSSFTEIESLLGKLEETITEYKRSSPGFIDEFLSPEGIITKKRSLDQGIQENRNRIAEKREYINSLRSENSALVVKLGEYRKTLEELNLNRVQMEAQIQSAEVQLRLIRRELTGQETSLRDLDNELYAENSRLEEITDRVHTIESEIAVLEHKGNTLARELEKLDQDIASRNSHVGEKQKKLRDKNTEMEKVQGQLEKYHMDLAMAETEIRNIKENFKDTHSRDLMEFEERMFTIAVPAGELREKLAAARQEVKELGNVNFMAPEEFAETKERYDRLSAQIADTLKARDDLRRIADEIRAESTELFLTTYNRIRKNFHNMFRRLFGGGRGELRLTDPQSVLESGVDIFAQPPGKKLENISLLSGGEKTMTAVALLFATYMVRPSPFCLLDEIDAALDEQNVTRFIHTLREFANVSQYIVITHNKKTVAGAGTMLGVTMEESGITKVITIRLENESGIVAIPDPEPFEEEDVAPEENVYIPPHPPRRHQLKETEPEDFVAAETDTEAEVKSETEESAPTETEGETTEES
ncbi:MAG: AAA family ATPase, partial [Spirochaetaceae bacterium]|nr:AAA family ATPase [Spirochaetaceae bacterium]